MATGPVRKELLAIAEELEAIGSAAGPINISLVGDLMKRLAIAYGKAFQERPRTKERRQMGQCPECRHFGVDCHCHRKKDGRLVAVGM